MPTVNTIDRFPPEVRHMIQQKLYERGFSDYKGLAKELTDAGHRVTHAALQRYGYQFKERMQQAEVEDLLKKRLAAGQSAAIPQQ